MDVTEERIRELVRMRIKYIDKAEGRAVDSNTLDLSGLLEKFASSVEARAEMQAIWQEEVCQFYDKAVIQASKETMAERAKKK